MSKTEFGALNEHCIAIIFKELLRKSMVEIRKKRFSFDVYEKILDSGKKDIYTDADTGAERIILKSLKECLPAFDIISEEDRGRKYLKSKNSKWITVDPLCGTKNFYKKSSVGIATNISMVMNDENDEIVSAYIGNVTTQEIFGYRPHSKTVYRISEFETYEKLNKPKTKKLNKHSLLIRGTFKKFSDEVHPIVNILANDIFEKYIIDSGSLSLSAVKLWIGEVGAILIEPRAETPWDLLPILGICQKLGFVYLRLPGMTGWKPPITKKIFLRDFPVLIIHSDHEESLNKLLDVSF